jgi:hypothetical protein
MGWMRPADPLYKMLSFFRRWIMAFLGFPKFLTCKMNFEPVNIIIIMSLFNGIVWNCRIISVILGAPSAFQWFS